MATTFSLPFLFIFSVYHFTLLTHSHLAFFQSAFVKHEIENERNAFKKNALKI